MIERGRQIAEELGALATDKLRATLMTLLFKVRDRVLKWQKGIIRW